MTSTLTYKNTDLDVGPHTQKMPTASAVVKNPNKWYQSGYGLTARMIQGTCGPRPEA